MDGARYPALLTSMPTPLETHKSYDQKAFIKTADVGQLLQVCEDELQMEQLLRTHKNGDLRANGLAPPCHDIVHRRYELTRPRQQQGSSPFLPYQVRQAIHEVLGHPFVRPLGGPSEEGPEEELEEELEEVVEEVVDFQPYMVDPRNPAQGRSLSLDDTNSEASTSSLLLLLHAEALLVTEEEREEDRILVLQQGHGLGGGNSSQALDDYGAEQEFLAVDSTNMMSDALQAAEMEAQAEKGEEEPQQLEEEGEEPEEEEEEEGWMRGL
eukprot:gene33882-40996_t